MQKYGKCCKGNSEHPLDIAGRLVGSVTPNQYMLQADPSDSIALTANLPAGFQATFGASSFQVSSGTFQTTMTITAPPGAAGNISASVTATDQTAGIAHSATGGILPVQDFTILITPPANATSEGLVLQATASGAWTVSIQGLNGFSQPVTLGAPGYEVIGDNIASCLGAGARSFGFTSSTVQPGQSVQAYITAPYVNPNLPDAYLCGLTFTATYGGDNHQANAYLEYVTAPDFSPQQPAPMSIAAGSSGSVTLGYSPIANFTGTVYYAATPGSTASAWASINGSTLTVSVPAGILPGFYALPIAAQSPQGCTGGPPNCLTHPETVSVNVTAGQGFSVTVLPTSPQPFPPGGSATYNVTVNGGGGYTGTVTLSAQPPSGWPANLGATLLGPGQSTTMTVTAPPSANLGVHTVLVAGAAGNVTHYGGGPITLAAPSPASIVSPMPGALTSNTVTFTWNGGVGAAGYSLALATSPNGSPFSYSGTVTTTTLPNVTIPSGAQAVYATLTTYFASGSGSQAYTYAMPPSSASTSSSGSATIRRNGPPYSLGFQPADTITGCSAPAGVTTVLSAAGGSQTVSIVAGPAAALGGGSVVCSAMSGTSYAEDITIDLEDPEIGSVDATQQPDGSFTVTITGSGFGDTPGGLLMQGVASYSVGNWIDNLIEVDEVVPASGVCGNYDLVVSPYVAPLDKQYEDEPNPSAEASVYICGSEFEPLPPNPTLAVTANGSTLTQGSCAYVSTAPQMPNLVATVLNNGVTPSPSDTVTWQLVTTFYRGLSSSQAVIDTNSVGSGYILNTSRTAAFPSSGPPTTAPSPQGTLASAVSQPANCPWSPWQASPPAGCPAGNTAAAPAIFGGWATINWAYNGTPQQPFNFYICGTNPDPATEQTYIQQTANTSNYWFAWDIALHETNATQFCESGRFTGPSYCSKPANSYFPIWGGPSGYGIMQVDPVPSQTQLWNWQALVQQAGTRLSRTSGPAFWNTQVQQFNNYNQGQLAQSPPQPTIPPPTQQEGPCTFTLPLSNGLGVQGPVAGGGGSNTYWFADAILIRNYNGAAFAYKGTTTTPNYISWQNSASAIPYWRFFKPNTVNADIVADVCACITGTCAHNASTPTPWLQPQTSIAPSTQTQGALTVQFTLSDVPALVNLTSSNPSIFTLPFQQIAVTQSPNFSFDVIPGAVTAPTLIQVTATSNGTTATASTVLTPPQ